MSEIRPLGATPFSEKKDKTAVNYRNTEKCQMCDFFLSGKCDQVEGNISPEAVCDLWQIRSNSSKAKHANFYIDEYKKRMK